MSVYVRMCMRMCAYACVYVHTCPEDVCCACIHKVITLWLYAVQYMHPVELSPVIVFLCFGARKRTTLTRLVIVTLNESGALHATL